MQPRIIEETITVFKNDVVKCGKVGYRSMFCESLNINDLRYSIDYGAYCVSNRNNQILLYCSEQWHCCILLIL